MLSCLPPGIQGQKGYDGDDGDQGMQGERGRVGNISSSVEVFERIAKLENLVLLLQELLDNQTLGQLEDT